MAYSSPADILKEGFLTKQGGAYRNWKKRWCVLREESLTYYVQQGDENPKKIIDLKQGRGVRTKDHCSLKDWPEEATFCFGLATSKRTWYFYGVDGKDMKDWSELIQQCIEKVGKPTSNWENDVNGKPEGIVAKAIRGTAKQALEQGMKKIPKTGNKYLDKAIKGGLNAAGDQLDADPHTSMKDRAKMAGGSMVTGVAGTVNSPIVSAVANVAKDQIEADEDLSLQERLALAGGSGVKGKVTKAKALNIAGGVGGFKGSSKIRGVAKAVKKADKMAEHYSKSSSTSSEEP